MSRAVPGGRSTRSGATGHWDAGRRPAERETQEKALDQNPIFRAPHDPCVGRRRGRRPARCGLPSQYQYGRQRHGGDRRGRRGRRRRQQHRRRRSGGRRRWNRHQRIRGERCRRGRRRRWWRWPWWLRRWRFGRGRRRRRRRWRRWRRWRCWCWRRGSSWRRRGWRRRRLTHGRIDEAWSIGAMVPVLLRWRPGSPSGACELDERRLSHQSVTSGASVA